MRWSDIENAYAYQIASDADKAKVRNWFWNEQVKTSPIYTQYNELGKVPQLYKSVFNTDYVMGQDTDINVTDPEQLKRLSLSMQAETPEQRHEAFNRQGDINYQNSRTWLMKLNDEWITGVKQTDLGYLTGQEMMGKKLSPEEAKEKAKLKKELQRRAVDEGKPYSPTGIIYSFTNMMPLMIESAVRGGVGGVAGALAGGAIGSAVGKTPAAATTGAKWGAKIGGGGAAAQFMMYAEGGSAFDTMRDMGIDDETARPIAIGVGVLNAGIEIAQWATLLKAYPGLAKYLKKGTLKISAETVAKEGVNSSLAKMLAKIGGKWLLTSGTEMGQEVAQEAVTMAGEEIGKHIENKMREVDDKIPQATLKEMSQRAVDTFTASSGMLLLSVPGAVSQAGKVMHDNGKTTVIPDEQEKQDPETLLDNKKNIHAKIQDKAQKFIDLANNENISKDATSLTKALDAYAEYTVELNKPEYDQYQIVDDLEFLEGLNQQITPALAKIQEIQTKSKEIKAGAGVIEKKPKAVEKPTSGIDLINKATTNVNPAGLEALRLMQKSNPGIFMKNDTGQEMLKLMGITGKEVKDIIDIVKTESTPPVEPATEVPLPTDTGVKETDVAPQEQPPSGQIEDIEESTKKTGLRDTHTGTDSGTWRKVNGEWELYIAVTKENLTDNYNISDIDKGNLDKIEEAEGIKEIQIMGGMESGNAGDISVIIHTNKGNSIKQTLNYDNNEILPVSPEPDKLEPESDKVVTNVQEPEQKPVVKENLTTENEVPKTETPAELTEKPIKKEKKTPVIPVSSKVEPTVSKKDIDEPNPEILQENEVLNPQTNEIQQEIEVLNNLKFKNEDNKLFKEAGELRDEYSDVDVIDFFNRTDVIDDMKKYKKDNPEYSKRLSELLKKYPDKVLWEKQRQDKIKQLESNIGKESDNAESTAQTTEQISGEEGIDGGTEESVRVRDDEQGGEVEKAQEEVSEEDKKDREKWWNDNSKLFKDVNGKYPWELTEEEYHNGLKKYDRDTKKEEVDKAKAKLSQEYVYDSLDNLDRYPAKDHKNVTIYGDGKGTYSGHRFVVYKGSKKGLYNVTDEAPNNSGFYRSNPSKNNISREQALAFIYEQIEKELSGGTFTLFDDMTYGGIVNIAKEMGNKIPDKVTPKPEPTPEKVKATITLDQFEKDLKSYKNVKTKGGTSSFTPEILQQELISANKQSEVPLTPPQFKTKMRKIYGEDYPAKTIRELFKKEFPDVKYRTVELTKTGLDTARKEYTKLTLEQRKTLKAEITAILDEVLGAGNYNLNLVDMIARRPDAFGAQYDNIIEIVESMPDTRDTAYHEAVHFVVRNTLTPQQKTELYKLLKKQYGDLSRVELDEYLAEGVLNYAGSTKAEQAKLNFSDQIKEFFKIIINNMKKLFTNEDSVWNSVNDFYADFYAGKFKQPVSDTYKLEENADIRYRTKAKADMTPEEREIDDEKRRIRSQTGKLHGAAKYFEPDSDARNAFIHDVLKDQFGIDHIKELTAEQFPLALDIIRSFIAINDYTRYYIGKRQQIKKKTTKENEASREVSSAISGKDQQQPNITDNTTPDVKNAIEKNLSELLTAFNKNKLKNQKKYPIIKAFILDNLGKSDFESIAKQSALYKNLTNFIPNYNKYVVGISKEDAALVRQYFQNQNRVYPAGMEHNMNAKVLIKGIEDFQNMDNKFAGTKITGYTRLWKDFAHTMNTIAEDSGVMKIRQLAALLINSKTMYQIELNNDKHEIYTKHAQTIGGLTDPQKAEITIYFDEGELEGSTIKDNKAIMELLQDINILRERDKKIVRKQRVLQFFQGRLRESDFTEKQKIWLLEKHKELAYNYSKNDKIWNDFLERVYEGTEDGSKMFAKENYALANFEKEMEKFEIMKGLKLYEKNDDDVAINNSNLRSRKLRSNAGAIDPIKQAFNAHSAALRMEHFSDSAHLLNAELYEVLREADYELVKEQLKVIVGRRKQDTAWERAMMYAMGRIYLGSVVSAGKLQFDNVFQRFLGINSIGQFIDVSRTLVTKGGAESLVRKTLSKTMTAEEVDKLIARIKSEWSQRVGIDFLATGLIDENIAELISKEQWELGSKPAYLMTKFFSSKPFEFWNHAVGVHMQEWQQRLEVTNRMSSLLAVLNQADRTFSKQNLTWSQIADRMALTNMDKADQIYLMKVYLNQGVGEFVYQLAKLKTEETQFQYDPALKSIYTSSHNVFGIWGKQALQYSTWWLSYQRLVLSDLKNAFTNKDPRAAMRTLAFVMINGMFVKMVKEMAMNTLPKGGGDDDDEYWKRMLRSAMGFFDFSDWSGSWNTNSLIPFVDPFKIKGFIEGDTYNLLEAGDVVSGQFGQLMLDAGNMMVLTLMLTNKDVDIRKKAAKKIADLAERSGRQIFFPMQLVERGWSLATGAKRVNLARELATVAGVEYDPAEIERTWFEGFQYAIWGSNPRLLENKESSGATYTPVVHGSRGSGSRTRGGSR
jgi:hypothetical protein